MTARSRAGRAYRGQRSGGGAPRARRARCKRRNGIGCARCGHRPHEFAALPDAYVYLLGLYLGDGHISCPPRDVYRLSIALDQAYPGIVTECADAMRAVLPDNRVLVQHGVQGHRLCVVISYSKQWACLFPQHGPGRKHERCIVLTDWQQRLVAIAPAQLVRGLIHSDGSRSTNPVRAGEKRYEYTDTRSATPPPMCAPSSAAAVSCWASSGGR
jgi:hypothetical protein